MARKEEQALDYFIGGMGYLLITTSSTVAGVALIANADEVAGEMPPVIVYILGALFLLISNFISFQVGREFEPPKS